MNNNNICKSGFFRGNRVGGMRVWLDVKVCGVYVWFFFVFLLRILVVFVFGGVVVSVR